jgi:hypothetical protein
LLETFHIAKDYEEMKKFILKEYDSNNIFLKAMAAEYYDLPELKKAYILPHVFA